MDEIDFFSSSDVEPEHHGTLNSENSRETPSTDNQPLMSKKTKNTKKVYQPIQDGNIMLRYEDDPVEYKRLRKKIQNRESAARIRGRKKGTMDTLEVQVEDLKRMNSELLVRNATLQTQNRALKSQVEFLRSVVKPNRSAENIDQYLAIDPPKEESLNQQYESPFDEQNSAEWIRAPISSNSWSNWSTLFVLSVVICVFVLPSSESQGTFIAQEQSSQAVKQSAVNLYIITRWLKQILRYLITGGFIFLISQSLIKKYFLKKKKKI